MQYSSDSPQHPQFRINVAGLSDIGKARAENEDYFTSHRDRDWPFAYLVVADGMGGYSGGALASKTAAETIAAHLNALPNPDFVQTSQPQRAAILCRRVKESIELANTAILSEKNMHPRFAQMGTTVVMAAIWENLLVVANVGDSRAYLWQDRQLNQCSRDHSLVQELVDNGTISSADARQHQNRNQLTRAVGIGRQVSAEVRQFELNQDSLLLLCSDGLTEYLGESEIARELNCERPLLEHGYRMIELANNEGGKDNITVALAEFTIESCGL